MGRWTQYDEDDYRLPEGMKRVGYDADSGRYYFRDCDGLLYKGPEGSAFGELTLESDIPTSINDVSNSEAAPTRTDGCSVLGVNETHQEISKTMFFLEIFGKIKNKIRGIICRGTKSWFLIRARKREAKGQWSA